MQPRILVAGPQDKAEYLRPYGEAIRRAGGEPVRDWPVSSLRSDGTALEALLARYNGLLLPGGADVGPERYHEPRHPALGETNHELDEGQFALARLALRLDFPTLAICRGLQVMAVAAGGKLYQDLPSQRAGILNHRIRTPKDRRAHFVEVDPESKLASVVGSTRFEVNSRHHQAAREADSCGWIGALRLVAWAPDGVIEGIEHPGHEFLMAVQWHPENLVPTDAQAMALFRAFVQACAAAKVSP